MMMMIIIVIIIIIIIIIINKYTDAELSQIIRWVCELDNGTGCALKLWNICTVVLDLV